MGIVVDLFCGAGGTSTGAMQAMRAAGRSADLVCVNHWPVAIKTHAANHPDAQHFCTPIEAVDPVQATGGKPVDYLLASPTCTYYSKARGARPTSDQQRMQPYEVVKWVKATKPKVLIVENVQEFRQWGPVCPTVGRPIKEHAGKYFAEWVEALRAAGMRTIEHRVLCCADYGDATIRKRFFLIARSDGEPITWPRPTHAEQTIADMLGLKPYRAASEIIDLSVPSTSIFDRPKPLASATLQRIAAGFRQFGSEGEPYLVVLRRHSAGRSLSLPIPTVTAGGGHLGLVQPMITSFYGTAKDARLLSTPLHTVTTKSRFGLIEPLIASAASAASEDIRRVDIDGKEYLVDIHFRMLALHELAASHSFPLDYEFEGGVTAGTRQVGNSVPVRTAQALVASQMPAEAIGQAA